MADGAGADFAELLPRFVAEGVDFLVIQPRGDLLVLQGAELLHFNLLAADVALILEGNLDLESDVVAQIGVRAGQVAMGDFGAAQDLREGIGAVAGAGEAVEFGRDGVALGGELAVVTRGQEADFPA